MRTPAPIRDASEQRVHYRGRPSDAAGTFELPDVSECAGFTDETVLEGTCVLVRHAIAALPSGMTRITYGTETTGPPAAESGPVVTGDFADVLRALKRLAEEPS